MLCAEEEKVLGLDTEKVLTTVWYYDDKGRVVQEIRTNIMGGYDKTYTAYTFTGLPSETLQEHTAPDKEPVTERYRFVYDNAERIKQKYYRLNSDAEILLQECTYNDFGQLQQESVNGGYVKHAYTYNVRGWLSGQTSGYGGSTDNAFDLKVLYTSNPKSGGSVSYNGNISAIEWTSKLDNVTRGYSFSYDGLGRMTSGVYGEGASLGTNTDRYNETLTYDRNGNIKTLLRSGRLDNGSFGPIDNLSMTLSGNRILSVAEGCANQSSNDLMEYKKTGSGGSRAYDANGRLTSDGNRGITGIEYNILNLPTKITFTNGSAIRYGYSYSGEKLWTKYSFSSQPLFEPLSSPATGLSATGNESERYYSGNKIYNDGTLDMILIDGGYIRKENTGYAYHHYIKDHLGSNRMVVKVNSGVQQVQHYYPFGLSFAEATNRSYQPYKYNGKELVSDEGLNWYDYLARTYDPALLIFTTMDPMAEKYYSISPYAYCGNNPIRNIDLNGDSVTVLNYGRIIDQHMAILIQNDEGKWQYYSVNGDNVYSSGDHKGGRKFDDIAVGEWDSPEQFMQSTYNSKGDKDDKSINGYGFSEGYVIPTTSDQDKIMRETFTSISENEDYSIVTNNCATAVQKSLKAVGIKTSERVTDVMIGPSTKEVTPWIPSFAFNVIKRNNPSGIYIRKK